jgi:type II secretory pathway pseudopilin PulG
MKHRRGILLIDVAGALVIVGMLLIALVVSMAEHRRAMTRLEDSRAATRLAERALADLQTSGKVAVQAADTSIDVAVLPAPEPAPPPGWQWVRVTVTHRRASSQLVGISRTLGGAEGEAP